MNSISTLKKITTCIIAGVVCSFCFLRIGKRFLADWISLGAVTIIALTMLAVAIVYAFYWSFRKSGDYERSSAILAFWQGIIRYGIAMDLTMIGFQKIFKLQVSAHLGALDLPFSSFSPEDLTWAYFAQSRALLCIIGGLQILGSFLLLFSRTRLAGVFVLLPIMLNIVLFNACYHMEWGESIQAIELLIALFYLLFCEYDRLAEFFFCAKNGLPSISVRSQLFKNTIRCSTLFIPLLLILNHGPADKNSWLSGKYRVSHLEINHQNILVKSCSDSILTTVYLDQGNDCVFEYNNQNRRLYGIYQLDKMKNKMAVIWHYPLNIHDTLFASITSGSKEDKRISGRMGKDSVLIELSKMK